MQGYKDSRYYRMIRSPRWLDLRRRKLNDSPLCELCLRSGLYVSASEVHHVTPCETAATDSEMERLMFSYPNLMSLCHDCHVSEHIRLKSHSRQEIQSRQHARSQRFIGRYIGTAETGEPFFIPAPSDPNPLRQIREIFFGFENSVGGKTPDGQ